MTTQHAELITADLLDENIITHIDVSRVSGLVEILFTEDYGVSGVVNALHTQNYIDDVEAATRSISETLAVLSKKT